MPIPEIIELFDSGAGSLTRTEDGLFEREATLRWLLKDIDSNAEAEQKVRQQAPDVWQGHYRQRLDVQPLGNKWWIGSATYVNPAVSGDGDDASGDPQELFSASVAFDTTGGTERITQAYVDPLEIFNPAANGERKFGKANEVVPSFQGAINVSGDQVNGIDVVVPVFNFTETWTVPVQYLTDRYVETLYELTGTTNKSVFRVFRPGECLFLGARCEIARGDFKAPITFTFSARPNVATKKVGDIIASNIKGWQYVWIVYESSVDNANLIKRPKFVYVNDIYGEQEFSRLGIGTTFPSLYKPGRNGPALPQ